MTDAKPTIDVRLRSTWLVGIGCRYDVFLDGEAIVRRSRDPEHDVARALLSRGLRGRFHTVDFTTGRPRMILDIAKAAGLRVVERAQGGIGLARHIPLTEATRASLVPHTGHQGRVGRSETMASDPPAFEANGGETCAGSAGSRAAIAGRLVHAGELEEA